MDLINNKPFHVTGISWHELLERMPIKNYSTIASCLNQYLNLPKYGEGVKRVAFIFISVNPGNSIHEERISFSNKKKEISLFVKLPYELVVQNHQEENLQLMAETYVESLADFFTKRKIKNFDVPRFLSDVQQAFEKKGWLISEKV